MKADIITIGDEILIGQITDTNSVFIAENLNIIGVTVRQIITVSDDKEVIKNAVDNSLQKADLVILSGGLGPTDDDKTKEALAEYFNSKLIENADVLEDIKRFVKSKNSSLNDRNIKQAEVPDKCKVIRNDNGTAAGMWFEKDKKVVVSMPAVPFEMKEMFENKVLNLIKEYFKTPHIIHKTIQTIGIPESELAEKLSDWEKNLDSKISLAYLPSPERIRLRLSITCDNVETATEKLDKEILELYKIIGKNIFGEGDVYLQDVIGEILLKNKKTLATAESCTGGNISRLITSVAGSSKYFKGSIVAYSNEVKQKILGVSPFTLMKQGAVSKETVEEMALGLLKVINSDYAIAVSGIAGPDGGTDEKPVGTIWIAVSDKYKCISKKYNFGNRRNVNVRLASSRAMDLLRNFIEGNITE